MGDDNKDLTNLLLYAKKAAEKGELPPAPAGMVMEENPVEKIEDFESLEDYAQSNPAPEIPTEPAESTPITEPEPNPPAPAPTPPASEFGADAFPVTDDAAFPTSEPASDMAVVATTASSEPSPETPPENSPVAFQEDLFQPPAPEHALEPTSEPAPKASFAPTPAPDVTPPGDFSTATSASTFDPSNDFTPESAATGEPEPEPEPELTPPPNTPLTGPASARFADSDTASLNSIKKLSQTLVPGKPAVQAALPFSLRIDGKLTPEEQEKLLDILARETLGIREIDLEPQLQSGKILIPRISEYAGILLVQALRTTRAHLQLGPSDQIFSTDETRTPEEEVWIDPTAETSIELGESSHPAENLPITTESELPDLPYEALTLIGTLTASAALRTEAIETERTAQYQEILEALEREIKYKAYRKGATAVLGFKVQLQFLSSPGRYLILVTGNAVKKRSVTTSPSPL